MLKSSITRPTTARNVNHYNLNYDLIIIGAGIHGAAVANAAAHDGYRICVLEQYDDAALATSSRSSKLIHGGLRYLESQQFKLVKECLAERATLLKTAPSLVQLLPFYIPIYRHSKRPCWMITSGLFIYRLLGGGRFKKVPPQQWKSLDGLNTDDLVCVYQYFDAVTDDQQLTTTILKQAVSKGAEFKTQTTVEHIQIENNHVEVYTSNQQTLCSQLVINASGPWINNILATTQPTQTPLSLDLVQGTHVIIPRSLKAGVYYFEASDQRVIFAIPWQQHCLLGTTETVFDGNPEQVKPLAEEIDYLLSAWNQTFNDNLNSNDLMDSFAGLRVLPTSDKNAFKRSRDTLIHTDNSEHPHLISIVGGKLTAHRATAERVMDMIHRELPGHPRTDTRQLQLPND